MQKFFEGERVARYQSLSQQITRRLTVLDSATTLRDLTAMKSNNLEALLGDRVGQHSIRIKKQWRLCFRWTDEGPCDVEIVDDH